MALEMNPNAKFQSLPDGECLISWRVKNIKKQLGGYLQKDNERNRQVLKPVTYFCSAGEDHGAVWAKSRLP